MIDSCGLIMEDENEEVELHLPYTYTINRVVFSGNSQVS